MRMCNKHGIPPTIESVGLELLEELTSWMKRIEYKIDELNKWADDIDSRLCEVRIKHNMSPHLRGEKINDKTG